MLRLAFTVLANMGRTEEPKHKYVVSEQLDALARAALTGDLERHGALFLINVCNLLKRIDAFNDRPDARGISVALRVPEKFDANILPDLTRLRMEDELPLEAVAGMALSIGTKTVAIDWRLDHTDCRFEIHLADSKRTPTSRLNISPSISQKDFNNLITNLGNRLGARQLAVTLMQPQNSGTMPATP